MNISLILIGNLILSWLTTKLIIKPFKIIIPDIPNQRSSHNIIKPRGGGLSFIISNLITSNIFTQENFLFLIPLSITGLIDDFLYISRWFRLIVKLATSCFILFESNYFVVNIRSNYLDIVFTDIREIMTYTNSSQYIDNRTKKGDNLRLLSPR